nr:hypothetical protein [Tanacetum cinerariifolium]
SPPSSQLPSASRREDRPDVTLPPRKRDRRAHAYTRQLMETKARMSREAWGQQGLAEDLKHPELPEEAGGSA